MSALDRVHESVVEAIKLEHADPADVFFTVAQAVEDAAHETAELLKYQWAQAVKRGAGH